MNRRARVRWLLVTLAVATGCCAAGAYWYLGRACDPRPPGEPGLLVERVHGALGIWKAEARAWRELLPGDRVSQLAPMRVSTAGSAQLRLGRSQLTVGPATRLTPKLTDGRPVGLKLERGSVRASVAEGDGTISVDTPLGRVDITAAEALVSLGDEKISVQVVSGSADLFCGGGKRSVGAGHTLTLSATELAPQVEKSPVPLAAAEAPPREQETRGLGRLVLRDTLGREAEPLEVRKLRVRVRVLGGVALTEIEQTFYNPTDRRAEGTFYFPVPAGASLSRFAMYVDGKLVEGELVEREKARKVYEYIVRRMQDPALMEWQEGNIFKTRIFPIPPKGPKRILIAYTQILPTIDGVRRYVYPLVNKTTQAGKIGRFELSAELSGLDASGPVTVPSYPDAEIAREAANAQVSLVRDSFGPKSDFVLRFTPRRSGPIELITDRRQGEDGFFMLSYLPPAGGPASGPQERGRDFVLMVDTSLSRRADDYRAQIKVVRSLLGQLGPRDRFAVISFDVAARRHHREGFVSGLSTEEDAVREVRDILPLGATDLVRAFKELDAFLVKFKARGRPNVILVSDGIATIGETAPEKVVAAAWPVIRKHRARFHALAMGARHERLVLRELARRSGGLFRVISPGDDVDREAFRAAMAIDSELVGAPMIEFSGSETHSIYPPIADTLVAGEETILLGRYKKAGKLRVTVRRPGGGDLAAEFDLPATDSRNVFIPRLWARERLEALLLKSQTPEVRKKVIDLSQEFTLITPYTSFLVLENEKAYVKYGIKRHKRRRYWEEIGKLRTAPPPEEVRPPAQPGTRTNPAPPAEAVRPGGAPTHSPAPAPAPKPGARPGPKKFTVADMDLSLLAERFSDGREVATALSGLCLEVYYRYLPMYGRGGAVSSGGAAAPRPAPAPVDEGIITTQVRRRPAPVQAEDLQPRVAEVPPPPVTDQTPENLETFETADAMDSNAARGSSEDAISNIPLGGSGVTGAIGVGGGGMAGVFGYRGAGGRERAVLRFGGSLATESAAEGSPSWLSRHQKADGRWGAAGYEETGLSLLAFMGAGYTGKTGKYRANVAKGIAWLISRQKKDGRIGRDAYQQALATLALSEAYGMGKQAKTGKAAQKALDRLVAMQKSHSGWGVKAGFPDPLTTAWAVMAVKSAKIAGLKVPATAFQGAMTYFDTVTAPSGAVGAKGKPVAGKVHLLNTAAGMVARQFMGATTNDTKVSGAADMLIRHAVGSKRMAADGLFLRYFGTMGLFQVGGPRWKKWNAWIRKELVDSQRKVGPRDGSAGDVDGSWDPKGIWILGRKPKTSVKDSPKLIAAALKAVAASPRDVKACESLATALAATADADLLSKTLKRATAAGRNAELLVRLRLGLVQVQRKSFEAAAGEFWTVYEKSGRPENVLAFYVGALALGGRGRKALETLLAEAGAGRTSPWLRGMTATLLFAPASKVGDPVKFVADRLKGAGDRHLQLKVAFAQMAGQVKKPAVQAAFFGQVYVVCHRPVSLVRPYISALTGAKRHAKASTELEGVIQGGYHTTWAFQSLAGSYRELGRGPIDLLRAVSSEVEIFPRDVQPRINLAQHYEAVGNREAALVQYVEAVRIRPEDPYFYRQAVERAVALGRYDLAGEVLTEMNKRWKGRSSVWGSADKDLSKLLIRLRAATGPGKEKLKKDIRRYMVKDIVVIMSWDTQGTDIDLHVTEPGGKECSYEKKQTSNGGHLDHDDTDGLGPETYTMRRAKSGAYRIDAVYFSGTPADQGDPEGLPQLRQ